MAISKKGKRKITVNSKRFVWWIFDEYDQNTFDGVQIKIVSEDQSVIIQYGLQERDESRCVVLRPGDQKSGICMPCPKFENEDGILTPSGIAALIKFCSTETNEKHKDQIVLDQIRKNLNTPS